MNTYTKECPICGTEFTTSTKLKKYCDKCAPNAGRKLAKLQRELARSKKVYSEAELLTYNCEYCGKEHIIQKNILSKLTIGQKSSWDGKEHHYCCVQHKDQARHDHDTCANCGKLLKDSDYGYNIYRPNNFCSEECENAFVRKNAEEKGWLRKCVNCGKEYIRKTDKPSYFCCRECQQEAIKNGWISPNAPKKSGRETVTQNCVICGKEFTRTYTPAMHRSQTCSRACANKWSGMQVKKTAENKIVYKKPEILDAPPKANLDSITTPLCSSCKTPYKKCERMQSEFRILPEGAHYNNSGVLVICPKYTK